jgi:hypothetical protein
MLAISSDWIYSGAGLIDAWLYHGYFHRYPDYVSILYPGKYYGTRLAWILPGYAAYQLLPAHAANLTLHLAFYYAAVAALYRATTLLTSRSAALISTCAFATATPTIVAFGWDHVDISVITYTAVALWAMIEAATARHRSLFIAASGAATACIVHSNLAAVLLGPAVVIAYLCTHTGKRWTDPVLFGAGAIGATAMLGLCNLLAGGPFFFFVDSIRYVLTNVGTDTFVPVPPLQWPGSARLLIPLTGLLGAVGTFVAGRNVATRAALLMQLWLLAAFVAYDMKFGGLLQTQYYVSWFLPLAAIGIAAAVYRGASSVRASLMIATAITVLQAITFGGWALRLQLGLLNRVGGPRIRGIEMALAAALLLTISVTAWRARRPVHAFVIAATVVLADVLVTPNLAYVPSGSGRSQFDAVQQTLTFIDAHVPRRSAPLFWIASDAPLGAYYDSLASTHLYLGALVSLTYPRLRDDTKDAPRGGSSLEPGDYVVVPAESTPDATALAEELGHYSLRADIVASVPVHTERASFVLTLLHVR